jgi:hypothetical protein
MVNSRLNAFRACFLQHFGRFSNCPNDFRELDLMLPQPGIVDYAGRTTDERCSKGQYSHFGDSPISKIAMSRL